MNDIIAEFALFVSSSVVLTVLVKSTVILILGLTVAMSAFRAKASLRHLVFATTFAALLALPLVVLTVPDLAVEVSSASTASASTSVLAPPQQTQVAQAGTVESAPASVDQLTSETAASVSPRSIAIGLLFLWAGGTLLLVGMLAVDLWQVRQLRKHGVPSTRLQNTADLLTGYGSRRVEVLMHESVQAPVTFGFLRPAIMLPTGAETWEDADIRRALIHELEHVRRADWTTQLAARLACSVYWFHPLAWMSWRRFCLEAERACDDAVVENAGHSDYAEQLVSLSRQLVGMREQAVIGMAKRSDLARRVTALLDETCRRGRAGAVATAMSLLIGLFLVISIGPLRAIAQRSQLPATAKPAAPTPTADKSAPTAQVPPLKAENENKHDNDDDVDAADVDDDVDVDVDVDDDDRGKNPLDTALFKAAERNAIERAKALIAQGANVNAVLVGDGTPLIAAAREGHLEMARLLLDNGAQPDIGVRGDGNALLNAARKGHRDVVVLLLKRGANIDAGVEGDGNALIMASGAGHVDIVALLLERGANIHKVVAGDENAIIKACETGQLDVVKLLLEKGADINSRVSVETGWDGTKRLEDRTPLSMARKGGHKAVVDYLLSKGAREQ